MIKCKATEDCENEAEYEFLNIKSCRECLREYWQVNEMGETESWQDFINYSCNKLTHSCSGGSKNG